MSEAVISFGPFRLLPAQQLLLEGDSPVHIGGRARDVLLTLISRPGELVTKEELIASVWPDTVVEESSLRFHVAALRRALGDGQAGRRYVVNVPGRGYSFVAPITQGSAKVAPPAFPTSARESNNLPVLATRVIGRGDVVRALSEQLKTRRLVSLVGPGGIGKTTVAVAVANEVAHLYPDGVRFVDLAPIADPSLVTSALAFVLDIPIRSDSPVPALIAFLKPRKMLVLLDSCEPVIDSVAPLVEEILNSAPGVHILATSRETLRVQDERVHRLTPLGIPSSSTGDLSAKSALAHPAVELFAERASASLEGFELSDADAPIVAEICRKLDGIALAIELAASLVDTLGVRGVADQLDDRFRLLTRGRRTALPRHRTLSAALDWSYELLPESLRATLRRLSVFAGWFTSESAIAVAAGGTLAKSDVIDFVADLVAKSLVSVDVDGPTPYFRLLDTTRAYAFQKLTETGEVEQISRSHASHYHALFERAEAQLETRPATDWIAEYGRQIENLRAALNWAFSPDGDETIGVELTIAAVPLWFQLSLINECLERVRRALVVLKSNKNNDRRAMKLQAALGWSLMYTTGPERTISAAWQAALKLAEDLADVDYQLRALWGLWASRYNNGEYREALALAERFSAVAVRSTDPADPYIGNRLIGVALHFLGAQTGARRHIERMLSHYVTPFHRSPIVRFQFEQKITARITLARILWLQGFADQALRDVANNINEALMAGHTLSLCNALANAACPVTLLAGDLTAAENYTAMLINQTEQYGLDIWRTYADIFRGELLVKRGQLDDGLKLLRTAIERLRAAKFSQYQVAFLGVLAECLVRAGHVDEGQAAIEDALLQCKQTEATWCMSELLRIKGEIALLETSNGAAVAEQKFLEAMGWAHRQQVLSWELRSATSLARLWGKQGRIAAARALLTPIYSQFTEGFDTADLKLAKSFLQDAPSDMKTEKDTGNPN